MSRWTLVATIIAFGSAMEAHAVPLAFTADPLADCTQAEPSAPPQPPQVPEGAELLRGEVTLIVSLDRCGRAVEVQVEKSSGDRTLDAAAVTAARTWHLPPQTDAQGVAMASKVRVPVKFDPDAGGPNPKATSRSRPRDGFFVARRAMQAKSPALLADGRVTGFVADEYPIGVASI
ncbi:MAG: energy transducer TonB, partial [Thermomonas sp.]